MRQIYDRFSTSPPRPELLMEVIRQNTSLPGEAFSEIVGCLGSLAANPNHFFVANLAGAGRVNAIITTNFDECIETALSAVGIRFRCFATDEEFAELAYILDRQMRTMFLPVTKIHGSVRDHRSIVMTLRDSARPLQEQKAHCLTQLINGRDLLVHGYSGRDDDIRPFFSTRPRDSAIYTGRSSARPLIARQWTAV
jgi:NAD-dependent SIR2 family protein deacetylase